MILKMKLT